MRQFEKLSPISWQSWIGARNIICGKYFHPRKYPQRNMCLMDGGLQVLKSKH
ncbi:MAG: hypothetical protein ACLR1V_12435 [Coprococcus sp.]